MSTLKVTLVRGLAGKPETQRLTVRSLGLRKVGQSREFQDSPALRGQLAKVHHLVALAEAADATQD
jgi:large subunit ribosomal protein L30